MWCISLPRILQNNDLQCWIKTAGVITNDGFPECIILYNALCTMHAGETMHCKPCYNCVARPLPNTAKLGTFLQRFCSHQWFRLVDHTTSFGMASENSWNGPLTRYVKLPLAHAPGMPGTFSPPPRVSDPDMHHGTCVTHVPWCMPGSLTSGFLWSRQRGKRSRHSRRMRNPQFYVSRKTHRAARLGLAVMFALG